MVHGSAHRIAKLQLVSLNPTQTRTDAIFSQGVTSQPYVSGVTRIQATHAEPVYVNSSVSYIKTIQLGHSNLRRLMFLENCYQMLTRLGIP